MDGANSMSATLDVAGLDGLLAALKKRGYRVIGPTVSDDAVVYGEISAVADLPKGVGDVQAGGHYRLREREDDSFFGYTVAPQGWKAQLYPSRQKLFEARRSDKGFDIAKPDPAPAPFAFIGVRACELTAIAIQAKVFGVPGSGGDTRFADPVYNQRLEGAFIVAVECAQAGETCFCTSMGSGPAVKDRFDLKLVEFAGGNRHVFLAEAGSTLGAEVLAELPSLGEVAAADREMAATRIADVARSMGRTMAVDTAKRLIEFAEHPRWNDVAERCLTCGNCTLVCPTCFCSTVEDKTDLTGQHAERWRRWDSCFSVEFSYIHGGAIRTSGAARYRQWITHKLSTWHEQFGSWGCVGCGRCITWCPVGIDITEEVKAIDSSKEGR